MNRKVTFAASVMVWGCMSAQGVGSLHVVHGTINAKKYQEILADHLVPSIPRLASELGEHIFQQDGASCHTARTTRQWFEDNGVPIMEWPSGSPDLSPIETLWGKMKKYLQKYPCRTKAELEKALQEIWSKIPEDYCRDLVRTMPRRIGDVLKSKGGITNW